MQKKKNPTETLNIHVYIQHTYSSEIFIRRSIFETT